MRGASKAAMRAGQRSLHHELSGGADPTTLGDELFAITSTLDGSATLRRALSDPSRSPQERGQLARGLLTGKVSESSVAVIVELASQRWSEERDLPDAVESLAVEAVMADAERQDRLDTVEDELFRFGRIVAGSPDLREALTARERTAADRSAVVDRLLSGKAAPETARLVRQAVQSPRGRRFDRVLRTYQAVAAARRDQLTATVTAAVELDPTRRTRLAQALSSIYGRPVLLNVIVDKAVVGGIRVQVGDEVVDGTIVRRLEDARRAMTG